MEKIAFDKYVLCGNKFVLVDECRQPMLPEPAKQRYSRFVTDQHYGIGCDNFLVLQPCTTAVLAEINAEHRYWQRLPDHRHADFIFRMFEPDGTEAFCCGNGLTCIAEHIRRRHGQDSARIMIEVPFHAPKTVLIGTHPEDGTCWTNLGRPRKMPANLVQCPDLQAVDDAIDQMEQIRIDFTSSTCTSLSDPVGLDGYLVFTGEPHMVVFVDDRNGLPALSDIHPNSPGGLPGNRRHDPDEHLIKHIGLEINHTYRSHFPQGLNVNFARIRSEVPADVLTDGRADTPLIRYRCFERGLNRETLACGTGAVATAFVAQRLKRVSGARVEMHPVLCRREKTDARLFVQLIDEDYYLLGHPQHLFSGVSELGVAEEIGQTPDPVVSEGHFPEQNYAGAYLCAGS